MSRIIDPDSLGFVVTDVGRLLRAAVEKRIADKGVGVTPGEARALMHASALKGGRQALLAERLGVEPMTVSGYVDRLEQRGLVRRRTDPTDRRAKLVEATDAADALIDEVRDIARGVLDEVLSGVSSEDRAVLEQVLKDMRGNLQGMLGCDRPARATGAAA
jgi:MarR family transcriptional regulator, transcriptional regulator for hemolysin